MADLNVMPFFTDAYLADTIHLSTEEHGVYLLLLVACWRAGGTLPNDHDLLCRICKVTPKHWPKVWAVVGDFFDAEGQVLTQKKLASTYAHQMERLAKARDNGKLGGNLSH